MPSVENVATPPSMDSSVWPTSTPLLLTVAETRADSVAITLSESSTTRMTGSLANEAPARSSTAVRVYVRPTAGPGVAEIVCNAALNAPAV